MLELKLLATGGSVNSCEGGMAYKMRALGKRITLAFWF